MQQGKGSTCYMKLGLKSTSLLRIFLWGFKVSGCFSSSLYVIVSFEYYTFLLEKKPMQISHNSCIFFQSWRLNGICIHKDTVCAQPPLNPAPFGPGMECYNLHVYTCMAKTTRQNQRVILNTNILSANRARASATGTACCSMCCTSEGGTVVHHPASWPWW